MTALHIPATRAHDGVTCGLLGSESSPSHPLSFNATAAISGRKNSVSKPVL